MDNGHEPATKADLPGAIQSLRDELLAAMHDMETRLLRAFYDFAESNQKRLSAVETMAALTMDRFGTIERRVTEIEKRLNMPPAP